MGMRSSEQTEHCMTLHNISSYQDAKSCRANLFGHRVAGETKIIPIGRRRCGRPQVQSGRLAAVLSAEIPAPKEDPIIQQINQFIEEQLDQPDIGIQALCQLVNLSRTQLFRRVKTATGQSPILYLRSIRLEKALTLLQNQDVRVCEVAYDLGFTDPNYFSRVFSKRFGFPPSHAKGRRTSTMCRDIG